MAQPVLLTGSPVKTNKHYLKNPKLLFLLHPKELLFRIYVSFIPPYNKVYQKIYVDLVGPLLAVSLLLSLLILGNSYRAYQIPLSTVEIVVSYLFVMPIICSLFSFVWTPTVSFFEIISMIGYGLYAHIFTLLLSLMCFYEESNLIFYLCLVIFGGLSTLRLVLIFLRAIAIPVARVIVCSLLAVTNILYLIIFHCCYVHQSYVNTELDE